MATLRIVTSQGEQAVEMSNATSMRYAAMHVAEALGLEGVEGGPRLVLVLAGPMEGEQPIIPEGEVAAAYDGRRLYLVQEV